MKLAIFGYGGHAREVAVQINKPVDFFVDDNYSNDITKPISSFNPNSYLMMVAVADSKERKKIVERLPKNTSYFTFIHPTALIMGQNVVIGEGSFIGAYSILTTNIKIGKHSILNRGNQVGHDSVIGNYFSAMPGAIVSGNVKIGNEVYMGNNSSIKEKIVVGNNIIIGMNSGVVKNITEPGTYVGLPSKKIK
jgi:sugar O-acyltransferase (sialic acid O-acetyltransferase NeuD family)